MGKVADKVKHKVAGGAMKAARRAKDRARALRGAARERLQGTSVKEMLTGAIRSVRKHYPFIDRFTHEFLKAFALNDRKETGESPPTGASTTAPRPMHRAPAARAAAKPAKRTRKKAA